MSRPPKKLSPEPVLERARKPRPSEESAKKEPRENLVVGEFLILSCPNCGQDTKLKSAYIGHRMGCGSCKAPLEIIEQDIDEKPEVSEEKPLKKKNHEIKRRPVVFRVLSEEDIAEGSDLEFTDEYERRRLPFEAPVWDDEDESANAKPRTRLLTHKEQVFRHVTQLIMAASLAVVAIILYTAVFRTVGVANKDDKTLDDLPANVQTLIDTVTSQEKPLSVFLTSAEEQAALAIVNGFFNAPDIESRLPFVRDPERVRPLMEQWYAREGIDVDWPDGEVVLRDKIANQGRYFIRLAIDFAGAGTKIFIIEQTKQSFALDWETATGYQPMPIADFRSTRPTTPTEFRVKLKPSDYYNYQFSDKKTYRAVELSYPGQPDFKLIGYFRLDQAWAPALEELLDAGQAPSLIVSLKYPDKIEKGDDLDQVEIISVVSETWWL